MTTSALLFASKIGPPSTFVSPRSSCLWCGLLAAVNLLGLVLPSAQAQCVSQQLIAADGLASDAFGSSVAAYADILAVGVPGDDDTAGSGQGSVRVSRWLPSTGWSAPTTLLASDAVAGDAFGTSVAVFGRWLVAGAPNRDGAFSNQGAAYVFELQGSAWTQVAQLTASAPAASDAFGTSVAIHGEWIVVGAPSRDVNGQSNQGAAYVFRYTPAGWVEEVVLTASDGLASDTFGEDVDIWGDRIIVGSDDSDIGGILSQGAAYVYRLVSGVWTEEAKFVAAGGLASDFFGDAVAIAENVAVVGAYQRDGAGGSSTGSVFVFRYSTINGWQQSVEIIGPDELTGDQFGSDVDVETTSLATRVLIGAESDDVVGLTGTNHGAAHLYRVDSSTATRLYSFNDPAGAASDNLGAAVALSSQFMFAGAKNDDTAGGTNAGSVWAFDLDKILPRVGTQSIPAVVTDDNDAGFGRSVVVNGFSEVLVGTPRTDAAGAADAGAMFLYERGANGLRAFETFQSPTPVANGRFGWSLANGSLLNVSELGTATVYSYSHGPDTLNTPTAFTGPTGINWGYSIAEKGNILVVGAPTGAGGLGEAYVYTRSGGTWVQEAVIQSPDGASAQNFGVAVVIDGSTAVIGDDQIDDGATSLEGAAYVFLRSGTTWSLQQKLTLPGANVVGANFGRTLALLADRAAIGSDISSSASAVHMFERVGTTWTAVQTIDGLGENSAPALDGELMAIGEDANKLSIYRRFSGMWYRAPSTSNPSVSSSLNVYAAALRGSVAVLGAIDPSGAADGEIESITIPDCTARVDNAETGESFSTIGTAVAAASPGDAINANSVATSGTGVDLDVTITIRGPARVPRNTTISLGDNNALLSDTDSFSSYAIFGGVRMYDFRGAILGEVFSHVEAGPSSLLDVHSGAGMRLFGERIELTGAINVDPGGILFLQPDDDDFTPRALVHHGTLTNGGVVNLWEQLSFDFKVMYNAADGTISGYGDFVGDFVNEGTWTVVADTQIDGALTNDGRVIVQSGTLAVLGDYSGSGTVLGDCPNCRSGLGLFVSDGFSLSPAASLTFPDSAATVTCGGDFDCAIDANTRYDMASATLSMFAIDAAHALEAMSRDIGPSPEGLDRTLAGHYPIHSLRISSLAPVTIVDNHDNDGLGQAACEAIYVDTLTIAAQATLNNPGCKIYYGSLVNNGVVSNPENLVPIAPPCPTDLNGDGATGLTDLSILLAHFGGPGLPSEGDINGDGFVGLSDLSILLSQFGAVCN